MNVYGKLVDILVGICIMLLFPVIYFNQKSELIVYEALQERMNEYVNEISIKGEITKASYEQFYEIVNQFDVAVQIDFQYEEYRYEPKYIINEVEDTKIFTGEYYEYNYIVTKDEIVKYLYEQGNYVMSSGGYFRLSVMLIQDKRTIYTGGEIRASLSLCDFILDHCNYLCYDT